MQLLLILGLVLAVSAVPQRLRRLRVGKQDLDSGYLAPADDSYGSPSAAESIETQYGAPADEVEAAPSELDNAYLAPAESNDVAAEAPLDSYGAEEELGGYDDSLDGAGSQLDEVSGDPVKMLMNAVPGVPGEDYPIYAEVPETAFSCEGQIFGGYYADEEAECQVFHICGAEEIKYSFLCPNGTIFNQNYFICDWWFNVDCAESAALAEAKNAEVADARDAADAAAADRTAAASENVDAYSAPSDEVDGGYLAPSEEYADDYSGDALSGYSGRS